MNREAVKLSNDRCSHLLLNMFGSRLPEGATELPEGAKIEFYMVSSR